MSIFKKLSATEKEALDYGFRWSNSEQIVEQIASEVAEISEIIESKNIDENHLKEEIGDLLHAAFSLCIYNNFDPETTLQEALDKFEHRFNNLKQIAKEKGLNDLNDKDFDYCMAIWHEAKK